MDKCKFCNQDSSYGNDSIYKDDFVDIFIVGDLMNILKKTMSIASKVKIKYCPICGKELK
jgi:hypothetical protein